MKNLKAIFVTSQENPNNPQNAGLQEVSLPDSTKVFVFNTFGSEHYDYFLRLGSSSPEPAKLVFRGLEYVEKASIQLRDFTDDSNSLIFYCIESSVISLRKSLEFHRPLGGRFFVNSVEFQARIEHAIGVIASAGILNKDIMQEWFKQEQANQKSTSREATFFNAPLSLFLAQDEAFSATDDSPRTKIILWGTLSTANLFASNAIINMKEFFTLPSKEVEEAIYSHFRVAWIAYIYTHLEEDKSVSGMAMRNYFEELIGSTRLLQAYGVHMMEIFRRNLYNVGTNSERYMHFSGVILPIFPDGNILGETLAEEFFKSSRILAFIASQTQWFQKMASVDLDEQNIINLNQNLYHQSIKMMKDKSRPEFQGFLG
ncbi:hypothetical protein FNU79_10185 [Deinococcus detaillensis]|uniref:Uncharacterized protein n=1 Tax=Deinococcus detaillensis TaxID=2592048 RepID=A0A553UWM0_9DEIO|nr:hypothetical protein [Deinococcus detaillensis]TSA84597.1 hypothetical protein FNU79_10185 [Deinococcus detaillensis]